MRAETGLANQNYISIRWSAWPTLQKLHPWFMVQNMRTKCLFSLRVASTGGQPLPSVPPPRAQGTGFTGIRSENPITSDNLVDHDRAAAAAVGEGAGVTAL
jgi:hypothetical protein